MTTPWEEAAERTKRFHTRKARKVVIAALEEIAPHSAEMLRNSLQSSKEDERDIDSTLMGVLVECNQIPYTGVRAGRYYRSWLIRSALKLSKRGSLIFPDIGTISHGTISYSTGEALLFL